jgi:lipopolysaccharide export system protein LptA
MRTLPFLLLALSFAALPAHAEKADREKPITVNADQATADDAKRTSDFIGNVVVTQGTMRITAAKANLKEDAAGFRFFVANGAPLTFRQKRDNIDEYIDGEAQRAEFDDKNDVLRLYTKARVKTGANEITGDFISYNMRSEVAEVAGAPPGTKAPPGERVKVIILPKKVPEAGKAAADGAKSAEPDKAPALQLKPDAGNK